MSFFNPTPGGVPGLLSTSPTKALSMMGGLAPGTNPMNPLQGQAAVSGIGQFMNQMLLSGTLRKATKLLAGGALPGGAPGAPGATAGGNPAALLSQLMAMLGQGGIVA